MNKGSCRGELQRETLDNVRNVVANLPKSRKDWQAFYGAAGVSENHYRGYADFHAHIIWEPAFEMPNLCALFQFDSGDDFKLTGFRVHGDPLPDYDSVNLPALHRYGRSVSLLDQQNEHPVFVGVVELFKEPEQVLTVAASTLVWLQCLDSCHESARQGLDAGTLPTESPLYPAALRLGCTWPVDANRKPGLGTDIVYTSSGVALERQLADKLIQGRAENVCDLSDGDREVEGHITDIQNPEVLLSGLTALLWGDCVCVFLDEPLSSRVKIVNLSACHRNPQSRAIKRMHESYSHHGKEAEDSNDATGRGKPVREVELVPFSAYVEITRWDLFRFRRSVSGGAAR